MPKFIVTCDGKSVVRECASYKDALNLAMTWAKEAHKVISVKRYVAE